MCFAGEAAFLRPTQYASSSHTFGFRAMEVRKQTRNVHLAMVLRIVGTNALRGPLALDSSKSVWPCDAGSSSHEVHAASRPGPSELCPGGAERGPTS